MNGDGFVQLIECISQHGEYMRHSEDGQARTRRIAEFRMLKTAEDLLRHRFVNERKGTFSHVSEQLALRQISPYQAAELLLDGINL